MKFRSLVGFVGACCALLSSVRGDAHDDLRLKWREMLVGPATFTASAARTAQVNALTSAVVSNGTSRDTVAGTGHWDTMDTSPGRTYLWSDIATTTISGDITASYSRLKAMALAYAIHGGALQGNTTLRDDIIAALDWLYANRYSPTAPGTQPYGNWWDWQIGVPLLLNDLTIIFYADLTATQRNNYMTAINAYITGTSGTGANLVHTAKVVGLRGLILKDQSRLDAMRSGVNSALAYVNSVEDGFSPDGSFIQHHNVPYTGSYGVACIIDSFELIYLLAGSSWPINGANVPNAYAALYDAFEPVIYRGEMMDMLRGREVSRYDALSHRTGRKVMSAYLRASQLAPAQDAAYYKRVVKHWLQSDTTLDSTYFGLSINHIILAEAIMADTAVTPRPELVGYYQFSNMDRAVQLNSGWAAGLAMHSSRIANYESLNNENLKGWNTASGMLYIYTSDLLQFSENFWPTASQFRMPGTTTESGQQYSPNTVSSTNFVGGVESVDLLRGVSAMDIAPGGSTLRGKKAWFFLDNEIVCLGAGITASGGKTVVTVVENRRLKSTGDNTFLVNNAAAVANVQNDPGTPSVLSGVNYAHLAGNVAGADLGYYFPNSPSLSALREERDRAWTDINTNSARDHHTTLFYNKYLTLYYDHGVNPAAATYSYAVLPTFTAAQTQSYAANPQYAVLENSTAAQAVRDTVSPAIGAVFWQDAVKTVGSGSEAITSNKKAAVFVAFGSTIDAAVSDPTRANTGTTNLEIGRPATAAFADAGITVTQFSPTIQMTFNASATYGRTRRVKFSTTPIIIMDNTDPGVTFTGSWASSTAQTPYQGIDYVHDFNTGAVGGKNVIFTATIATTGSYRVYVRWTSHTNRATNVQMDVGHGGGTTSYTGINQQNNGGAWYLLGTHTFNAGASGFVRVRNDGANGYVVADAVRFEPL